MNASDREIVTRYDDLGLTPEDIAADLSLETDAVRMVLSQYSANYKSSLRESGNTERKVFNELVANRAASVMEQLLYAEDESVRYRAAKFVIDEHRGRNDAAVANMKAMQNVGIGILQLNTAVQKARMMRLRREQALDIMSDSVVPDNNGKLKELVVA